MSAHLTIACQLAELGYKVFPLSPRSKIPFAGSGGVLDATNDIDTICRWWEQSPDANIGLSTEGLLVVDVDGADNPWHTPEFADKLLSTCGAAQRTPSGGWHYIYRAPNGHNLRNTAGIIAPKIDTRANGGYIVLAPSVTNVGRYQFIPGFELNRAAEDLPIIPLWLHSAQEKKKDKPADKPSTQSDLSQLDDDTIPDGQRNAVLTSIAGRMRNGGLSQTAIDAALQVVNRERCRPPIETDEVAKIAASIARYEPGAVPEKIPTGPDPEVLDIARLVADFPNLRPAVVARIMRRGETVNIIAKSKVGKSWFGYLLALCVATGRDWLGFQTTRGRVLIIDNELHPETLANRLKAVLSAMGLEMADVSGWLDVVTLRGQCRDINTVAPILQKIPKDHYGLIIIDALYRLLPDGTSENDNAQMMMVFNAVDAFGALTGAAIVLIHHASKGGQSDKDVVDVGSGAGAISRAADTHLILRPHEEDDAVVLDARLRSWEPLQPIGLRWHFPVWQIDGNLDPEQLKGRRKPLEERKEAADKSDCDKILDALKDKPASINRMSVSIGIGKQKLQRLVGLMVHGKRLVEVETNVKGNPCIIYAINPNPPKSKPLGQVPTQEAEYDSFA